MGKIKNEELEIRTLQNAGNLRAFVTLKIGPLEIKDFRIVQQDGQRAYVSPPQAEYSRDGKKQFNPLLKYPPEWKEQIETAVFAAWAPAI